MTYRPIIAGLLITAALGGLGAKEIPLIAPGRAAAPEQERIVAAVQAVHHDLSRAVTFSAELRPYEEVDLHAKVAGYLKTITVDIGDRVKAGQTLARLDIDELRDDLLNADAVFKDASQNYDRIQDVVKGRPGLLAQEDVDKAETAFAKAKAQRERAATMLGYATITAPFGGVVTKRYVDPGALVQAGTASSSQAMPVVHVADDTTLRLSFPIPAVVVPLAKVGTPVDVTVAAADFAEHGRLTRISGKVDTATRTMEGEVDLDNHEHRMTPGMYATATLVLEHKAQALTLPVEAISSGLKPTVWVINAKSELEERPITIGMRTDSEVEVTAGLSEGEKVVFGSRNTLALGMKVTPKLVAAPAVHE